MAEQETKLTEFTPIEALAGGVMIGVAAVLLLALNGRIAGISGIAGGLLRVPAQGDIAWRICFIIGLAAAPWIIGAAGGAVDRPALPGGVIWMAAGGLLVGFGTALGGGCTSGHGVCGMARLSARSIAATLMFMATGVATVFVIRHLAGDGV